MKTILKIAGCSASSTKCSNHSFKKKQRNFFSIYSVLFSVWCDDLNEKWNLGKCDNHCKVFEVFDSQFGASQLQNQLKSRSYVFTP